jgi:hypothetical protein
MKEKWNRFLEQVHHGNTIRVPIFSNIVQKRDWIMLVLEERQAPFWTSDQNSETPKGRESGSSRQCSSIILSFCVLLMQPCLSNK